jgi:malate dehydrogenase (quinone)
MSQANNKNTTMETPGRRFSRRQFIGAAVGAAAVWGGYSVLFGGQFRADKADRIDVLLIGGGIMSATLGVCLAELEPGWTFEVFERLDKVAEESSTAGTTPAPATRRCAN